MFVAYNIGEEIESINFDRLLFVSLSKVQVNGPTLYKVYGHFDNNQKIVLHRFYSLNEAEEYVKNLTSIANSKNVK